MNEPWIPERTRDGSWTLRHPEHGQACHSLDGAWREAVERYARPCRLAERAGEGPVRLLDLGTGVGWNLAAALGEVEGAVSGAGLEVWSFEVDARVIRAARELPAHGDSGPGGLHRRVLATLGRALDDPDVASGEGIPWDGPGGGGGLRLFVGDARELLPTLPAEARFDAVFLDGFSPGVESALWEPVLLREVAGRMAPGSLLSTYTTSLRVRAALAAAGLRVGVGPRVGQKAAGTLASPDLEIPPLPERTARKLVRRMGAEDAGPRGAPGKEIPNPCDRATRPRC